MDSRGPSRVVALRGVLLWIYVDLRSPRPFLYFYWSLHQTWEDCRGPAQRIDLGGASGIAGEPDMSHEVFHSWPGRGLIRPGGTGADGVIEVSP